MAARILAAAALLATLTTAPALAADPGKPEAAPPVANPNEVVCKSRPNIGSRLGGSKSCRTRQEWADMRQQTRETVERSQQLWQKDQQ